MSTSERIAALLAEAEVCRRPLSEARSLPPALFHDAAWYDLERERLFHGGWVAVCRIDEVASPNDFVTASIAGEPCVVVRRRDGDLAAMSNVCPHRGSTIVGDAAGSAPSFQCSYHLWTFAHDGRLRSAPAMYAAEGFELASVCLQQFAVEEWHGFVWVNVDAEARPLSGSAPQLDQLFEENRLSEVVPVGRVEYPSPWNWKISVENFLESYHHRGIHPETLDTSYPGLKSFATLPGDEPWSGVDHVRVDDGEPFIALAVYPSTLIAINRGIGMIWFRLAAVSVDHCHLVIEPFVLPELADEPGIGELYLAGLRAINDEDALINERTAAGLRSKFAAPGRVSHLEGSPWHFRRWLLDRMDT